MSVDTRSVGLFIVRVPSEMGRYRVYPVTER